MEDNKNLQGVVLGDRVKVERQFETGGQAKLFLVKEIDGGGRVLAAKLVIAPYDERNEQRYQAEFRSLDRELDILGDVSHRFIAKMLFRIDDVLDIRKQRCVVRGFVMEHAPTGTLARFIGNMDEFPPEERVRVCHQVAEAVDELHNLNITHSDIKAENVLVTLQNGKPTPVLIDFGAAFRAHESWPGFCSEPYLAPELRDKKAPASSVTDIFALGTLFSEVLSGKRLNQPSEQDLGTIKILTIAEDTRQLLLRMVYSDDKVRPPISEVVTSFEERRNRIGTTNQLDKRKINFPYGDFRWFGGLHRLLKCRKHLILLKGTRPTVESDALLKDLEDEGFFAPLIRRIVGDFDFVLEIWCSEQHFARLIELCTQFNLNTTRSTVEPLHFELVEGIRVNDEDFSAGDWTPTTLIQTIREEIQRPDPDTTLNRFEELGFGRRVNTDENTIDFNIFLDCNSSLTDQAKRSYQGFLVEYLNKKLVKLEEEKLKERCLISLLKGKNSILLQLSVTKYRNFSTLLLGSMRELRTRKLEGSHEFSPRTYVDFDGVPRFIGFDGAIPRMILESS